MPYISAKHLRRLREIAQIATMDNASFYLPGCNSGLSDTERIREATKNWRESWIVFPLNSIIESIETKTK